MKGTYPKFVREVALLLRQRYGDHDHNNRKNPFDELLFIVCSTQTQEGMYEKIYRSLRTQFRQFSDFATADVTSIEDRLRPGGLYAQKSKMIKGIVEHLIRNFGRPTLAPLRKMDDAACEEFLTELPGVGKKIARCVLLYSLERKVFPVDTHCWRISRRLGWVRPSFKDGRCTQQDMDRLQKKIPPQYRFSLHVNMVSLGRELCTANSPQCSSCPLEKFCPKVGV